MRDSIGGTMLFWIVLLLLSIFIVFIAFIIKYARVYKIKNTAVSFLERNEGVSTQEEFENVLLYAGYPRNGGYKICRYFPSDLGMFYYVELYSNTEFPLVGSWVHATVHIKGETRVFDITKENIELNQSDGTSNDNTWFFGQNDQCYLCVLGDRCKTIEVE